MPIRRRVEMQVEDTRQAVLFEIRLALPGIEAHVQRLKDGAHAVVVGLLDGIVFVIVAFHTLHRHTEKGAAGVLDGFIQPCGAIEEVVAAGQKAGGAKVVAILGRELVGGEHLHDHLIVAFVSIQRLHDPIPPVPDVLLRMTELRAKAVPVAITPDVHEVPCPALSVLGGVQEAVNDTRIRLMGRMSPTQIRHKGGDLLRRRRQADEIEINTTQPDLRRGLGLRFEFLRRESRRKQRIHRLAGGFRQLISPMRAWIGFGLFIGRRGRTSGHPGSEFRDLFTR